MAYKHVLLSQSENESSKPDMCNSNTNCMHDCELTLRLESADHGTIRDDL